jgi:putative DNA primase/helicase
MASEAVEKCFRAWLSMRGGTGPLELASGIKQVRKFIEEHGESRFAPWNEDPNRPTIHRAGFRRRADSDAPWEYYILTQTFREEVCKGYDMTALARELARQKMLIPSSDGKLSRSIRIPAIGEKTTRVYHITSAIFEADDNEN